MEDNEKIKQLNTEAENVLVEIRNKNNEIATLVGEIKGVHKESNTIIDQIKVKQTSADTKLQEIEAKATTVTSSESSVATLLQQIQTKVAEAEALAQHLVELRVKIEDGTTGVDATLVQMSAKNVTVTEKVTEAETLVKKIAGLSGSATKLDTEIKTAKEQIEGYKKEIEAIYGYINGQGLSHSFSERQKSLNETVVFWRNLTFVSVAVLVGIFWWISTYIPLVGGTWEAFLYKLTYSSPGIFLVWFSALQYSRERRLLESYAFKASTAKALENYTEVLERRFSADEYKKDILDFVLSSMRNIYQHPNNDKLGDEDKKMEDNMLEKIGISLKDFGEKVIEPVTALSEKIKGIGKVN